MSKSERYCIRCGREIGESPTCTNPECGGIPNFYRNVPGPRSRAKRERASATSESRTALIPRAGEPSPTPAADDESRRTMPLRTAPVAFLEAVADPNRQHAILPGTTEIGAHRSAGVVIDLPEVSSNHAAIECETDDEGRWTLTIFDHGSTNGTFVGGERIDRRVLERGDVIRFATVEFVLRFPLEDEPRVTMQLP